MKAKISTEEWASGLGTARQDEQRTQEERDAVILNEVQVILSEKRTSLSAMRTGIAVIALPLTIVSFLIITSKLYSILHVIYLFVPLMAINVILVALGSSIIIRAALKIRRYDRQILYLKRGHGILRDIID